MVLGDDDWIDQGYVAGCLEVLQAEPDVAVVVGRSCYYTASGEYVSESASPPEVLQDSAPARVCAYYALEPKPETFYGLLRASALRTAAPMRNVLYNDGIFAATLVLGASCERCRASPCIVHAVARARIGKDSADAWKTSRAGPLPTDCHRLARVSDTAGGHRAYRTLPLPTRLELAGQCARTTFSWRGLAFSLLGPDIAPTRQAAGHALACNRDVMDTSALGHRLTPRRFDPIQLAGASIDRSMESRCRHTDT